MSSSCIGSLVDAIVHEVIWKVQILVLKVVVACRWVHERCAEFVLVLELLRVLLTLGHPRFVHLGLASTGLGLFVRGLPTDVKDARVPPTWSLRYFGCVVHLLLSAALVSLGHILVETDLWLDCEFIGVVVGQIDVDFRSLHYLK